MTDAHHPSPAIEVRVLRPGIDPNDLLPATSGSAGYDLRACLRAREEIAPGAVLQVPTGLAFHLRDKNLCGIIAPRSGMGTKGLVLANTIGVIDSDYQGEILLSLWNRRSTPIVVNPLERVAQLLVMPVATPYINFVDSFTVATGRGEGGFGSTGTN